MPFLYSHNPKLYLKYKIKTRRSSLLILQETNYLKHKWTCENVDCISLLWHRLLLWSTFLMQTYFCALTILTTTFIQLYIDIYKRKQHCNMIVMINRILLLRFIRQDCIVSECMLLLGLTWAKSDRKMENCNYMVSALHPKASRASLETVFFIQNYIKPTVAWTYLLLKAGIRPPEGTVVKHCAYKFESHFCCMSNNGFVSGGHKVTIAFE